MSKNSYTPLSLSQYFDSPDGYAGLFGWLCGYSADADFMDLAVERFTGQTHAARAASGRMSLALMLDMGNPQISPVAVPGVLHIAARSATPPYRLLHAKVALLGFRHKIEPGRWLLRLLVSTGNWTSGTLRDSLDLAWCVDVDSASLDAADAGVRRDCADVAAAWDMLSWLRTHHDDALFSEGAGAAVRSESHAAAASLEAWIDGASRLQRGRARFIDNRNTSLLTCTVRKLRGERIEVARNYLAMGSGFFEAGSSAAQEPAVLRKIVTTLQQEGWLTRNPGTDVVVDERACQAVAVSAAAIISNHWTIRQAGQPSEPARKLHAKFVFSANRRSNSNLCGSPWLYMGSGNLTAPGFTNKMSRAAGNLEAGAVLVPEQLYWRAEKGGNPACVLGNLLPIQFATHIDSAGKICAGAAMAGRETQFAALPFSYLCWRAAEGGGWLLPESPALLAGVSLHDGMGGELGRSAQDGAWWPGAIPRQVRLSWDNGERSAAVPVIDGFGRIAGGQLASLDLDAASWELERFPGSTNEDGPPDGDGPPAVPPVPAGPRAGAGGAGQYAVRKMMVLVEQIAEKQSSLHEADWQAWCYRLEQVLIQARDNPARDEFAKLALNPFSPLYHPPFRPGYAETGDSAAGKLYEAVLQRLEQAWDVAGFDAIGGVA